MNYHDLPSSIQEKIKDHWFDQLWAIQTKINDRRDFEASDLFVNMVIVKFDGMSPENQTKLFAELKESVRMNYHELPPFVKEVIKDRWYNEIRKKVRTERSDIEFRHSDDYESMVAQKFNLMESTEQADFFVDLKTLYEPECQHDLVATMQLRWHPEGCYFKLEQKRKCKKCDYFAWVPVPFNEKTTLGLKDSRKITEIHV